MESNPQKGISDYEILMQHHQFVREEEDDQQSNNKKPKTQQEIVDQLKSDQSYGEYLAKKYYDKLYKEYAIADLQFFEQGHIGLRWRTKEEVLKGKGFKICGNKKCDFQYPVLSRYQRQTQKQQFLETYELNFKYKEQNEKKNTLVKLRVCPECGIKLNYKKKHTKIEQKDSQQENNLDDQNKNKQLQQNKEAEIKLENDDKKLKITENQEQPQQIQMDHKSKKIQKQNKKDKSK